MFYAVTFNETYQYHFAFLVKRQMGNSYHTTLGYTDTTSGFTGDVYVTWSLDREKRVVYIYLGDFFLWSDLHLSQHLGHHTHLFSRQRYTQLTRNRSGAN
jgi:hypothetical protein